MLLRIKLHMQYSSGLLRPTGLSLSHWYTSRDVIVSVYLDRKDIHPQTDLASFKDVLQADAYAGFMPVSACLKVSCHPPHL